MAHDGRRRGERVEQLVELDREHRLGARQRHQIQLRGDDQAERPLRADNQLGEVEGLRAVDELVEVVAADAPQHFREAAVDFAGAVLGDLPHRAVGARLERIARDGGVERRAIERTETRHRAVRQHDVELEDVIDRLAVQDRAGAARVVRDHAADGGAAGRRDVGREPQPVRPQLRVQVVEDDARLDPRRAIGQADVDDLVEVLRGVELQSRADRLARLRRAAPARGDRAGVTRRDLDGTDDVFAGARHHDAERFDLVDAGVGGIERPRHAIESNLALDLILKIEPETLGRPARRLATQTGVYCLSYTWTLSTLAPAAFVPVLVTVMVFPSDDTTRVYVCTTLPAFLRDPSVPLAVFFKAMAS